MDDNPYDQPKTATPGRKTRPNKWLRRLGCWSLVIWLACSLANVKILSDSFTSSLEAKQLSEDADQSKEIAAAVNTSFFISGISTPFLLLGLSLMFASHFLRSLVEE